MSTNMTKIQAYATAATIGSRTISQGQLRAIVKTKTPSREKEDVSTQEHIIVNFTTSL